MNFDKILFRILIIKTLYQCGFSQPTLVAPLSEIMLLSHGNISYVSARIGQYDNEDRFCIMDDDMTLYDNYFQGNFSSKSIEFSGLYGLEMEFFYRRRDEEVIWFKCSFSEKCFTQAFFRKIYSYQLKGEGVAILKIARFFNTSKRIEPYVTGANLSTKDTGSFSKGLVERTYFITHSIDLFGTIEVDFIFSAKQFAISKVHDGNKIALCINDIPEERILISFSNQRDMTRFFLAFMHDDLQLANPFCPFPNTLTSQQIVENLGSS